MKVLALLLALCGTAVYGLWPLIANAKRFDVVQDICTTDASKYRVEGEDSRQMPH